MCYGGRFSAVHGVDLSGKRTYAQQDVFHDLKSEAVTKAHLFLQNQVDAQTMQSIYLNNKKFINEVEVAVYSADFQMLYHDAVQNDIIKEDRAMIDRILKEKEMEFYIGKYQAVGIRYSFGGKDYIVTAVLTTDMATIICWSCRKRWSSCLLSDCRCCLQQGIFLPVRR